MAIKLNQQNLSELPSSVAVPDYDRASLSAGIIHFGVGNFHRAHQAVYLDRLFNAGSDLDWAILGAGVLPSDEKIACHFAAQDYLYTVVEQAAESSSARIIGVMQDVLPPSRRDELILTLADPAIRIVSLTITEGGYFMDGSSGLFNPEHPAIVSDVANPDRPASVFGIIIAGLKKRRALGLRPFTVMSCDNIPHNGDVTRRTLVGVASLIDPALANWIDQQVAFPNGMVDRITPATGDKERNRVQEQFGLDDQVPVFCEDFIQWVMEDTFCAGRPAWETVGVKFVEDVSPFEMMKIRILNGGHALIGYVSGLLDIQFAHEAMAHPLVRGFIDRVEREEVIPVVPPVPDTDLQDYFELIKHRFSNPAIEDTIQRLCWDGSNRQPKFLVPTILDRLKQGESVEGLALGSALWCRYCYGISESGRVIPSNDPDWDRLNAFAQMAKSDPMCWLGMEDIYGKAARSETFQQAFSQALKSLWDLGVEKTVMAYINGHEQNQTN